MVTICIICKKPTAPGELVTDLTCRDCWEVNAENKYTYEIRCKLRRRVYDNNALLDNWKRYGDENL